MTLPRRNKCNPLQPAIQGAAVAELVEQTILEFSKGDYISATAHSFLIARQESYPATHLNSMEKICVLSSITRRKLSEVHPANYPDSLRHHFLAFGETDNPNDVHAACFQWPGKDEILALDWKNPMLKVRAS